jgi:hypothetical protein
MEDSPLKFQSATKPCAGGLGTRRGRANNLHLEFEQFFSKLRFDVGLACRYSGKDFWRSTFSKR